MKNIKRLLSVILVATLLFQMFPSFAFAGKDTPGNIITEATLEETVDTVQDETFASEAYVVNEMPELRSETEKHFRMSDGSFAAVEYDTPVNYQDESGEWKEINNSLKLIEDPGTPGQGEAKNNFFIQNGNHSRTFNAELNSDGYLFSISDNDYSLTMFLDWEEYRENSIKAEIQNPIILPFSEQKEQSLAEQVTPQALSSTVTYSDVWENIDLEYQIYSYNIKENIILNTPTTISEYAFILQLTGLNPKFSEDGSIAFINETGKNIYCIPAPYMEDANGEVSTECQYELKQDGEVWRIKIVPDSKWINDPQRQYPIKIDPTIQQEMTDPSMYSSYVRSGQPYSVRTDDYGLYVGDSGNAAGKMRSYVHINSLPDIPVGSEVCNAFFAVYQYSIVYKTTGATLDVGLYGMECVDGSTSNNKTKSQWHRFIDALTWNDVNGSNTCHNNTIIDKRTIRSADNDSYINWDFSTLAYQWYDRKATNIGFALIALNEDNVAARVTMHGERKDDCRPYVIVGYRNVVGIEPIYTYQSGNIGNAGAFNIGDYSMQNTLVVPLISSASDSNPFALSLIYNSAYGTNNFSSSTDIHTKDFSYMILGTGWKLSAQESVVKYSVPYGEYSSYLIYTDGDGTEHYFIPYSSTTYQDEDGLGLKVTVSGTSFSMTDDYGNKKTFTNGYLTSQEDAYGNKINYIYNANHQLKSITRKNTGVSTTETLATLTYDTSNRLSSVIDEAGRTYGFSYNTFGGQSVLTQITFPGAINVNYEYYTNSSPEGDPEYALGRLHSAYDSEANYGIEFSYTENRDVHQFLEYVIENGMKEYRNQMHGYKRAHRQATYRFYGSDGACAQNFDPAADDILTFFVFDQDGRTICSYSTDNSEEHILGVSSATYTTNSGASKKNNRLTAAGTIGQQGINLLKNSKIDDYAAIS